MTLDDVSLDTTGWTTYSVSPFDRAWFDQHEDPVRLRVFAVPCPEVTVEGWRARAGEEMAAAGGALVSFDEVRVDGRTAFRGLFKFPATRTVPGIPASSLAVYVVGMLAVPLAEGYLQVNTEALERGTTGAREATYQLLQPRPEMATEMGRMDDHFARVRETLAMVLPSDHPRYDELAPTHPLSRVRAMQRHVMGTLRINAGRA